MDYLELLLAAAVRDRALEMRTAKRIARIKRIDPNAQDRQEIIEKFEREENGNEFLQQAYDELFVVRDFIRSVAAK